MTILCGGAATVGDVARCEERLGIALPSIFVSFISRVNGVAGDIAPGGRYAYLWPIHDVGENQFAYDVREYLSGLLLIGSNGCGEALALDLNCADSPLLSVPFVYMARRYERIISMSIDQYLRSLLERVHRGPTSSLNGHCLEQEVFDVKPVILGGDGNDRSNKRVIGATEHKKLVRFWNRLIMTIEAERGISRVRDERGFWMDG